MAELRRKLAEQQAMYEKQLADLEAKLAAAIQASQVTNAEYSFLQVYVSLEFRMH